MGQVRSRYKSFWVLLLLGYFRSLEVSFSLFWLVLACFGSF